MAHDALLIELTGVSIVRGNVRILDNVNLRIPQREHVAIVGPNGSGKSTLLKLLMKFFYPSVVDGQSGTVAILGKEEWNVWALRAHLGFVSSEIDHHFMMGRSARLDAITTVLTGFFSAELEPAEDLVSTSMQEEAQRLLDLFQVDSKSSKCIGNMSTGERRRVLLARAMARNPQAIVLDEPTNGLDLRARADFLRTLNKLATGGTQVVLVTHHLEEILPCIDRTILLKAGKVFRDAKTSVAIGVDSISSLFDCRVTIELDTHGFYHSRCVV